MTGPAVVVLVVREERRAVVDAVLGFCEVASFRCLVEMRRLGNGRGRASGPRRESREEDEDERERIPFKDIKKKNQRADASKYFDSSLNFFIQLSKYGMSVPSYPLLIMTETL